MCALGAPACSAFVSLDGLNDGGADAEAFDASSDASDAKIDGQLVDSGTDSVAPPIDAHATVPPTFRSLTTGSTSGNSVTVTRAPQIEEGDLMIALVYEYQDSSSTTPPDATWQPVTSFHDPGPSYEVHYFQKFASSAEPSSYTFATLGIQGGYASVTLLAYSGVDPVKPIDFVQTATFENANDFPSPAPTTTENNTLVLTTAIADGQTNAIWSAPSNVIEREATGFIFVGDEALTDAGVGSSDAITCSIGGGGVNGGVATIVIRPQ